MDCPCCWSRDGAPDRKVGVVGPPRVCVRVPWYSLAMHKIDVAEATIRFAELLRRVQAGEEVVVTEEDAPIARIVPAGAAAHKARFGAARGLLQVRDDFDEPLEDFAPYTT